MVSRLEMVFLANVVLKLTNYIDIHNFILVSHNCYESVKSLKTTPKLSSAIDLSWFLSHFYLDTVDFDEVQIPVEKYISSVQCIRNPNFLEDAIAGKLTQSYADTIFPKVVSLSLLYPVYEKDDPCNNLIISNSKKFMSLRRLSGDLEQISLFLKNLTDNGEAIGTKYPNLIVIDSYLESTIVLNETTLNLLRSVELYLKKSYNEKVCYVVAEVPEDRSLIDFVKKGKFYCKNAGSVMCNKDDIFGVCGDFELSGEVERKGEDLKILNERIGANLDAASAFSLTHKYMSNTEYSLELPDSVREYNICVSSLPELVDANYFKYPINFNKIEVLKLVSVSNVSLEVTNALNCLELKSCDFCVFTNDEDSLIAIEEIFVEDSKHIRFLTHSEAIVENVHLFSDTEIDFNWSIKNTENVEIVESRNVGFVGGIFSASCIFHVERSTDTVIKNGEQIASYIKEVNVANFVIGNTGETKSCVLANKHFVCHSVDYLINNHFSCYNEVTENVRSFRPERIVLFTINNFNETSAKVPYFEVKEKGCMLSLGLYDTKGSALTNSTYPIHVGWENGSLGIHTDDWCLYGLDIGGEGENVNVAFDKFESCECVIGCGYNNTRKEVFFTLNGKIVKKIEIPWKNIGAAFAVQRLGTLFVNTGDQKFTFDIENYK
ncbi:hypothetical protein EIN_043770 [Entamoeba invadens IP1]|uniref:B30.2/SPRY domain-containing protein n=1 Tax=Entamoeba invadens IP1 TaxID=370355 RepID=A0A0A1TZ67_ENTIV|nr:hypothetical protein EIN_043770 [Entamoeba invadens IP1]ELP86839.1 hypothetical protein EIN_043770 [Entamoeba invadens IP1]|eukprot:XP_004253610.1 hypothetical protein EIN_043770 [Entamoeba invadens IP1]